MLFLARRYLAVVTAMRRMLFMDISLTYMPIEAGKKQQRTVEYFYCCSYRIIRKYFRTIWTMWTWTHIFLIAFRWWQRNDTYLMRQIRSDKEKIKKQAEKNYANIFVFGH